MNWAGAGFVFASFVVLLVRLGAVARAKSVAAECRAALAMLRDPLVGDDVKEVAMRRQAKACLGAFVAIAWRSFAAAAAPLAMVFLLSRAGLVEFDGVLDTLASIEFVLLACGVTVLVGWLLRS